MTSPPPPWGSYPAYCYKSTGDGFSGWYAISSNEKCVDFCFWDVNTTSYYYDKDNTADPHQTTTITTPLFNSTWRCAMNVAQDDNISFYEAVTQRLAPPGEFFGDQFDHLRCNRGAKEQLSTPIQRWMRSPVFWSTLLIISMLVVVLEIGFLLVHRRKKRQRRTVQVVSSTLSCPPSGEDEADHTCNNDQHEEVVRSPSSQLESLVSTRPDKSTTDTATEERVVSEQAAHVSIPVDASSTHPQEEEEERPQEQLQQQAEYSTATDGDSAYRHPWQQCGHYWLLHVCYTKQKFTKGTNVMLLVLLNMAVAYFLFVSILALVEIGGHNTAYFALKVLTPACTDPSTVCHVANQDIDQPSFNNKPPSVSLPFSYLIASDAQLDWYAGESAYMGRRKYPPPCDASDSCASCSAKVGTYTNQQMKRAMERLINNDTDVMRPKTLIMNGDLTAYFHRWERKKYESTYHNMKGLEHYFPSLGNHDYDHYNGATYNGDEWWFGAPSCNAEHAVGYLKGGFCHHIPHFDPQRIIRYDAKSLAYSWEEGRYHFVHLHYYPTFENARIGIASSMEWLERDLTLANEAGLTTILFVHASQGLHQNRVMERIVAGKNVAAIFAGHLHRCLHNKCVGLVTLNTWDVAKPNSSALAQAEKCLPATTALCGGSANTNFMSLFYIKDVDGNVTLPDTKLFIPPDTDDDKPLCPKGNATYINETDNTLLCRMATFGYPNFPFTTGNTTTNKIPIFWSGSASFEAFLRADFYDDRIVVNALTAEAGIEGKRYVDTHEVPNAVYPYHAKSDLEEVTIYL